MAEKKLKVVLGADVSGFKKAMDDVQNSTKSATDSVKSGFGKLGDIFKSTTSGIGKVTSGIGSFVAGVGKIAGASLIFKGVSAGVDMIKSSFDGAISRVDTLNQFPRVLQQMGYSAEEAQASTTKLSEGIKGLPTTLDGIVGSTQRLVTIFGDVGLATDTALALNNAFLASGASSSDAARGLEQYTQMLSAGKVDMQSWRTLQETMPYALNETAKAFGFTGASAQNDFYAALKDGDITFDQFNSKIIELSQGTGGFAEVALEASKGIQTSWANIKTAITTGVANIIASFDTWLNSKGFGGIAGVLDIIKTAVQNTFKKINEVIPVALEAFEKLYTKVADSTAFNTLKDVVTTVKDKITELWEKFEDSGALDTVKGLFEDIGTAILDIDFVQLLTDLQLFLDKWSPVIAGITAGIVTFIAIQGAISLVSGVVAIATAVWTAFGVAIAFVTSPIGIVVIAIGALVAIGVLLYKNWDEIKLKATEVWGGIKTYLSETIEGIKTTISEKFEEVKTNVTEAWENIKDTISTKIDEAKTKVSETIEDIKTAVATKFDEVKTKIAETWQNIKDTISTKIDEAKTKVSETVENIKTAISTKFNDAKTKTTEAWQSIKDAISTKIEEAKTKVSTVADNIKTAISTKFNDAKTKTTEAWQSIKDAISTKIEEAKTKVSTVADNIKTAISSKFDSIKSSATTTWDNIKSAMTTPVETAKNTISKIIDTIKGFFSGLSLKLPKIQMPALPHFSLSGSFSLMPPSVPKLSVSWYETGGIATGASVVGIGENGTEAILPLSNKKRMQPFASAVASMMQKENKGTDNTGGDTIITGNHFVVREEADIKKIAQALHKLQQRESRLKGVMA